MEKEIWLIIALAFIFYVLGLIEGFNLRDKWLR